MKITVSDTFQAFQPVTLEVTIETEAELANLLYRFVDVGEAVNRIRDMRTVMEDNEFDNQMASAVRSVGIERGLINK